MKVQASLRGAWMGVDGRSMDAQPEFDVGGKKPE